MQKGFGSGVGSRSISQRYGSGDPDPDPHQNVTDPPHWQLLSKKLNNLWWDSSPDGGMGGGGVGVTTDRRTPNKLQGNCITTMSGTVTAYRYRI